MTGAERTKKWRERKNRGVVATVLVEITAGHVRAFISSGRLIPSDGNTGTRIRRMDLTYAVQEVIDRWALVD